MFLQVNQKGKENCERTGAMVQEPKPAASRGLDIGADGSIDASNASMQPTHKRSVRYLYPLPVSFGGVSPFLYKDISSREVHTDKFIYGPRRAPASVWIAGKYAKRMPAADHCASGITNPKPSNKNTAASKGRRYSAAVGSPGYPGVSGSALPNVQAKQYALETRKRTRIGHSTSRSITATSMPRIDETVPEPKPSADEQRAMYRQFTHEIPYLNLASYAEMDISIHPESSQSVTVSSNSSKPLPLEQPLRQQVNNLHMHKPNSGQPARSFSSSTGSVGSGSSSSARQYSAEELEALKRMENAAKNRDVHDMKAGHGKESSAEKAEEHWSGQMPREEEVREAATEAAKASGQSTQETLKEWGQGKTEDGPIRKAVGSVGEGLEKVGKSVAPGMTEKVKNVVVGSEQKTEEMLKKGAQKMKDYWDDSTKPIDPSAQKKGSDWNKPLGINLDKHASDKVEEWEGYTLGSINEAKEKAQDMWNKGVDKTEGAYAEAKDKAEDLWEKGAGKVKDAKETLKATAEEDMHAAEKTARDWKGKAEGVVDKGMTKASEWKSEMKHTVEDYSKDAEKVLKRAESSMKEAYEDVKDKAEDVMGDVKHSKPMKAMKEMAEEAKEKGEEYIKKAEHAVEGYMKEHPHPIQEAKEGAEKYTEPIKHGLSSIAQGMKEGARESIDENDPNLATTKESLKEVGSNVINIVKDLGHVANVGADVTWRAVEGAASKLVHEKEPESAMSKSSKDATGSVADMADYAQEKAGEYADSASEKLKDKASQMASSKLKEKVKDAATDRVTTAAKNSINPFKKGGFIRNLFWRDFSTYIRASTFSATDLYRTPTNVLSFSYTSASSPVSEPTGSGRFYSYAAPGTGPYDQNRSEEDAYTDVPFPLPGKYSPWVPNQPHGVLHGEFGQSQHEEDAHMLQKRGPSSILAADKLKTPISAVSAYRGAMKNKKETTPFDFDFKHMDREIGQKKTKEVNPMSSMDASLGDLEKKGKRELDAYFQRGWAESVVSDSTTSPFVPKTRSDK